MKKLKSIIFLVKSFLGNFYRHLAIFSGHTDDVTHTRERERERKAKNGSRHHTRNVNRVKE